VITTRREFIRTVGAAIASSQLAPEAASLGTQVASAVSPGPVRPAGSKRKVIYDQDNSGPFGTNALATLMMLQTDDIDLLGITLVTGDAWLKQEIAFTLRLLEMMGRPEIPVYPGAEFPMINTKEEWLLRLQLYGGHPLDSSMGAFESANGEPNEIAPLPPPYDGFASLKAQSEHAARFIIQSIRENPGQVTVYAGGPLTNLALAIALAPDIVPLVPEVVIVGTGFHVFTNTFNMLFDPEAARKVLRAPWPRLSIVPVDLAEEIHTTDEIAPGRRMIDEIARRADRPISDLFQRYAVEALRSNPQMHLSRMGDEMSVAQLIDPSIFTKSERMYVDICSTPGPRYGDSMFWPQNWREAPDSQRYPVNPADQRIFVMPSQFYLGPPPSAGLVNVLLQVDHERFQTLFVDLMTKPIRKS
jgi:purine nucleosidase